MKMDDKNIEKEFKDLYDKLIYTTGVQFYEVFASFYDVLSQDKKCFIYVEPLVRVEPSLIMILEKYFNLKKVYSEDMPDSLDGDPGDDIVFFTDDEPDENKNKTLTFIGCKEKRKKESSK